MSEKIGIDAQIMAVELETLGAKGHLDNLKRLVAKKQRDEHELAIVEQRIPALEAALATLRWLKGNEARIKDALS